MIELINCNDPSLPKTLAFDHDGTLRELIDVHLKRECVPDIYIDDMMVDVDKPINYYITKTFNIVFKKTYHVNKNIITVIKNELVDVKTFFGAEEHQVVKRNGIIVDGKVQSYNDFEDGDIFEIENDPAYVKVTRIFPFNPESRETYKSETYELGTSKIVIDDPYEVDGITAKTWSELADKTLVYKYKQEYYYLKVYRGITLVKYIPVAPGSIAPDQCDLHGEMITGENKIIRCNATDKCTFQIFVKTLTGKTIVVGVSYDMFINDLCKKIEEKTDVPGTRQRLIYAGKQLQMGDMIKEYGINQNSTVSMVLNLRGGGGQISFAKLEDGNMKIVQWSHDAPRWRVVKPGLSIESMCCNYECDAYRQFVIVNLGYSFFDLAKDNDKLRCPMCDHTVVPKTCGFNNCKWGFIGLLDGDVIKKDPVIAGDEYTYFGEDKQVNWDRLLIYAGRSENTCKVCYQGGSSHDYCS